MRVASTLVVIGLSLGMTAACSVTSTPLPGGSPSSVTSTSTPDPATGLLVSGRRLTPYGTQVELGNFPTGAAVTADGRFLWTVSTGFVDDLRIVDVASGSVCQTIALPGASGGIALDSTHHLAYVAGLPVSAMMPSQKGLAGAKGDVVLVYSWTDTCGGGTATLLRTIAVPPPAGSQPPQQWPPLTESQRPGAAAKELAWPQKLAVSPDGSRLLVPLNLVDSAAVVDLGPGDAVHYVTTGRFPFAAAITPDGTTGLVTNEAAGTVSVLDLATATKTADIVVGTGLSHAQAIVVDAAAERAYVSLSESDDVVVVDLADRAVERTISVGIPAGLGTRPVALAVAGDRLYVAQSGDDEITVVALPSGASTSATDWGVIGRIPTSDQPQSVAVTAPPGGAAQLVYVTAKGLGIGPNPTGPNPASTTDPIFAVFSKTPPTTDVFTSGPITYDGTLVTGRAGIGPVPTDSELVALTAQAGAQTIPVGSLATPTDTVVRPDGPITHVFFVVRENRSYDQMLGDVGRGNSDPALNVFDRTVTPNMHALVSRFPLLDNTYANSEASIEGHFWTAATTVPDYANRNWFPNYSARGRANDFGEFAVSWPGNGFLFDQAERQGISYFNFGEGLAGNEPGIIDLDRTSAQTAESAKVAAKSDVGPPFGGCYPGSYTIGFTSDKKEIFDSSLPVGAPAGSFSHVDCFRQRFTAQVAANAVPALTYLSLTGDHTLGTIPGARTPAAMIADDDKALGELVETISHSPIWGSSAIFVVEDDSQDGADHVAAHRIPALVISPYAKSDSVVSTRYDLVSVIRTMELMIGLRPLTLNDALATPMYDAFATAPVNLEPWTTLPPQLDLLARNTAASPAAAQSAALPLGSTDTVPQVVLDAIRWKSVHGEASQPPPPGPGSAVADGILDEDG